MLPQYRYSWKRQNWFEFAAKEHLAVREGVGLFDLTSFAKFRVEGRDAESVLQKLSANNIAVSPGRIVYGQWLNQKGGIEADLTITRISETVFLIVTAAGSAVRDFTWLRNHIPDGSHCTVTDLTAAESVFSVAGPRAREFLQNLTTTNLSNDAFPYSTAREIELGMACVRAHRISYVGELGWEIYVSSDQAMYVFDLIIQEGSQFGLRLCGMHVLDSCRIEKAFRHFGQDITDEDHVLEAGLGFLVKTEKPDGPLGSFIGRDAVILKQKQGLFRQLVQFRLQDPEPLLFQNEPIFRNGTLVGRLTSGNYGHYLGAAVGLGYVSCDSADTDTDILEAQYEIMVAGQRISAVASVRPMYDPSGSLMRS